jgi:hypothetical protein
MFSIRARIALILCLGAVNITMLGYYREFLWTASFGHGARNLGAVTHSNSSNTSSNISKAYTTTSSEGVSSGGGGALINSWRPWSPSPPVPLPSIEPRTEPAMARDGTPQRGAHGWTAEKLAEWLSSEMQLADVAEAALREGKNNHRL